MRILQIIDSLEIGGAEKMAINYANSLAKSVEFSGIVVTRKEGNLLKHIDEKVHYLFLKRKKTLDLKAIVRLKKYCKENEIAYVQAHSSSFFTAFLLKLIYPKVKLIWHDHNGLSEFISSRKSLSLQVASYFFEGIIVVNDQLKQWAERTLHCKKVIYLANFTTLNEVEDKVTKLHGTSGKRILCLANLRFQKNHFILIEVAKKMEKYYPEWTFHLVGKDFEDAYSAQIKKAISDNNLTNTVFVYGSKQDTQNCIEQSEICILTSQSEGLPVALLEYGLNKKAVVTTNVGEISMIIKNNENGFIVSKFDSDNFYLSLEQLVKDENLRRKVGYLLYDTIIKNNSEAAIMAHYLQWLQSIKNAN